MRKIHFKNLPLENFRRDLSLNVLTDDLGMITVTEFGNNYHPMKCGFLQKNDKTVQQYNSIVLTIIMNTRATYMSKLTA